MNALSPETDLVLATNRAGLAVLHIFEGGHLSATVTGSEDDMRSYAAEKHPGIAVEEITKVS